MIYVLITLAATLPPSLAAGACFYLRYLQVKESRASHRVESQVYLNTNDIDKLKEQITQLTQHMTEQQRMTTQLADRM